MVACWNDLFFKVQVKEVQGRRCLEKVPHEKHEESW
jgi:hypothetical protein